MSVINIFLRSLFLPVLVVILIAERITDWVSNHAYSWDAAVKKSKLNLFHWLNKKLPVGKS